MIFVTVGTHEQPFDRLLKCIDKMVEEGKIHEKVIIQKGYTDYEPQHCESSKLISYEDMQKYINEAESEEVQEQHFNIAKDIIKRVFGTETFKLSQAVPSQSDLVELFIDEMKEIME